MPHTTAKDHLSAQLSIINPFILKKQKYTNTSIKKILFHNPISLFGVLAPRMSSTTSSTVRSSSHRPANSEVQLEASGVLSLASKEAENCFIDPNSISESIFSTYPLNSFFCRKNVIFSYHKKHKAKYYSGLLASNLDMSHTESRI